MGARGGKCFEPGSPKWELGVERWELDCVGEYSKLGVRVKPVYPSKASTTVVCELFGAFELSGGKNEIVAIILRLTPDRHFQHKTSDETYLGHFQSFKYGHAHHNWR